MIRQVVVILSCNLLDQRKLGTWNAGKIVMLVVIPNVESQPISWTVVRIRFAAYVEHIMVSDKVASQYQTKGEDPCRELY